MGIRARVLCLVVLVLTSARLAGADPIRVTGGSLNFDSFAGKLRITGERGFTFGANVDAVGGIADFARGGCHGESCDPGTSLSLFGVWSGNDLIGPATLDGRTLDEVGGAGSDSSALAQFSGAMVAPPAGGLFATVRSPFAFEGFLHVALERFDLIGSGTATGSFFWSENLQKWFLDRTVFEFEGTDPVPEPATLLLIGTGIGATLVRRRGGLQ